MKHWSQIVNNQRKKNATNELLLLKLAILSLFIFYNILHCRKKQHYCISRPVHSSRQSMEFHLDRDSSIPLGAQLRGMIEYAITFGALKPGEQLPSVREMADILGVAPMTVAQVYRETQGGGAGLQQARCGHVYRRCVDAGGVFGAESRRAASTSRRVD
ncbi:GntR family transcriptional regulator [Rouxiella badensis]|nr:GntR family transcriptional regulator [Rouxiella badensis]